MAAKNRMSKGIFKQEQHLLGVRISARMKQALDGLEAQEELIRDMEDAETPAAIENPPYK